MPLNQDLLTIKDNIQNSVSNIIEAIQLKYVDVNIDNVKLSNLDSYINNIPIDIDTQKNFLLVANLVIVHSKNYQLNYYIIYLHYTI